MSKGWILVICGLVFGLLQTAYFGWNLRPESKAENVCDMITCFAVWFGLALEVVKESRRLRRAIREAKRKEAGDE